MIRYIFISLLVTLSSHRIMADILANETSDDVNIRHDQSNMNVSPLSKTEIISEIPSKASESITEINAEDKNKALMKHSLFYTIIAENYKESISLTKSLKEHEENIVSDTVSRLMNISPRSTLDYAYQLWTAGENDAVIKFFPTAFKHIFNGDTVRFVSPDREVALQLSQEVTVDERYAEIKLGEVRNIRGTWKLIPVWQNDRVYFKILNVNTNLYLHVLDFEHFDGDRGVWASMNVDDKANEWYLTPLGYNNTFSIINRQYNLPLVFNVFPNMDKEFACWVRNEEIYRNKTPEYTYFYRWSIVS